MEPAKDPPTKEPSVHVDLWFPVTGRTLPSDHGYALYSALCRLVPTLHAAENWGLHTLRGEPLAPGIISLSRSPRLGLRLPSERIPLVLPLAGRTLEVRGHVLVLSSPTVITLAPHVALSARIVTIKPFLDPESFTAGLRRQLTALDPACAGAQVALGARKVVTIDGRKVVGFSVRLSALSDRASILLQEHGIGGRRKLGCGVFRKSEQALAVDARPQHREAAE
jgi:CRISPR-associated endonuclease/helicase Cas3